MKPFYLFIGLFLAFSSCKKAIEKAQEDAVIKVMINGQWKVTKYLKGTSDVTTDFISYKFQFYENGNVDAIKNNVLEKTGTWTGDANTLSISSNFSNAVPPLSLLNGTFQISKSGQTYVEASGDIGGENNFIRLEK